MAGDFFTVPTATFRVLFVFIMLAHERRRMVPFNITEHLTVQWDAIGCQVEVARQIIDQGGE